MNILTGKDYQLAIDIYKHLCKFTLDEKKLMYNYPIKPIKK